MAHSHGDHCAGVLYAVAAPLGWRSFLLGQLPAVDFHRWFLYRIVNCMVRMNKVAHGFS
jgi:hypothetical protein